MPREAKRSLIGMPQSVDAPGKIPTGEWPLHSPSKASSVFAKTNVAVVYLQTCLIRDEGVLWMQDRCPGMEPSVVPELSWLEAPAAGAEEIDKEEPMTDQARAG